MSTLPLLTIAPACYYADMTQQVSSRPYDLFIRDPYNSYKQMQELGEYCASFSAARVIKNRHRFDEWRFMNLHFGNRPWRSYTIGNWKTMEYDHKCEHQEPAGVYPSWHIIDDTFSTLKDYIDNPWNKKIGMGIDWTDRPKFNQPHRIFIVGVRTDSRADPSMQARLGKLRDIQLAYPEVEFFIHGTDAYPVLFGLDMTAGDFDPYRSAQGNKIILPGGRRVYKPEFTEREHEIKALGFTVNDLIEDPTNCQKYNIASARYAAHHWSSPTGLLKRKSKNILVDKIVPTNKVRPHNVTVTTFPKELIKPTDKIACDACSLWRVCHSYRKGSVCNLPGTESKKLSEMALSRDAGVITNMLASIVSKQAERVETVLDDEKFNKEINPEVDKMLNNLFKNGVQLAKLRDPNLGRPLVQINNVQGSIGANQKVANADPRGIVSHIVSEIEATGIDRSDITEQMIKDYMSQQQNLAIGSGEITDAEVVEE